MKGSPKYRQRDEIVQINLYFSLSRRRRQAQQCLEAAAAAAAVVVVVVVVVVVCSPSRPSPNKSERMNNIILQFT